MNFGNIHHLEFGQMAMAFIFAHLLCDFPLQGDFLSAAKNRHKNPYPDVPWWVAMGSHAGIHACAVYFITGSWIFGLAEFVIHTTIDICRTDHRFTFLVDQILHYATKALFLGIIFGFFVSR